MPLNAKDMNVMLELMGTTSLKELQAAVGKLHPDDPIVPILLMQIKWKRRHKLRPLIPWITTAVLGLFNLLQMLISTG